MTPTEHEDTLRSAGPSPSPAEAVRPAAGSRDATRSASARSEAPPRLTPLPPPIVLSPGTRIGDYVIDRLLGEGGFSAVYGAAHAERGTPVAIKVLRAELVSRPEVVLRFEREVQAIQRVRHPGVVEVLGHGRLEGGRPYFVMDRLTGVSLEQHLRARGRLPAQEVLAILEPLCSALEAAHAQAIIHRDLKASNVFLCPSDGGLRVVLLDFGVAKLLDATGPALTASRHVVGTPACIAPEQILGQAVDPRTDVYALGVLTYRMLVGEPPFAEESYAVLRQMHLYVSPPRPSARGRASPELDEVILRAMSKDRAARQPTIAAFLTELRAAADAARGAGALPEGGRARRALAIYAEVRAAGGDLEDPDDRLLSDLEAILPFVTAELSEAGLSAAVETGSSLLFTVDRPDDPARDEEVRRRAVGAALAIHRKLEGRPDRDPRVHVRLCLHAGELLATADGALVGGGLLEVTAWVPDDADDGVLASPEVVADLGLASSPEGSLLRLAGDGAAT